LNLAKKALSLGTSAALVASLLATVAAPAAFAAITVGSAGNVPQGGTSANNVSFTFTEQAVGSLGAAILPAVNPGGSFTVTLGPAGVTFSGTPSTAGSTGSLGASASVAGNVLTVSIAGSDSNNIETINVTGLKLAATSTAALGAITATMGGFSGNITSAAQFAGGGTSSGTIAAGVGIGATSVIVNVTTPSCLFTSAGTLDFATSPESVALTTAAAGPGVGQQTLTIGATGSVHNAGEVVSETNGCSASNTLASPGTVVAALSYSSANNATVYPGETNQIASNLSFVEPSAGFLAAASTFTFTILTPGVVFSTAPTVADNNGVMALSTPVISADRLSATVTVNTASTVTAATVTLSGILYDVAATVTSGTFISVGLTTSAAQAVLPASVTNAVVFRGVLAVSATTPTVYIGENNQAAGVVSFTESAAGFFTDGVGTGTNTFQICPSGTTYRFTLAPVAMVKGGVAAGNLILRDGAAASTTNIVVGTNLGNGCYGWTVWTASTTASTIVIGAAPSAATGALINVTPDQAPGGVNVALSVGSSNFVSETLAATVQFATAVYRNQVAVTALSQPVIAPGAVNGAVGNIQIAETGLGQLKANEAICFQILWQAGVPQNTFMNSNDTADLPIATASGTGLVIGPVVPSVNGCTSGGPTIPPVYMASFSFTVLQQSTAGDGKIVVSNMRDTVLTGATAGPVQVSVNGNDNDFIGGTQMDFHTTVSNALIGAAPKLNIAANSALGLNPTSGYTMKTPKYQTVGKYVTWKFTGGPALAGQRVNVLVAKHVNGAWGGPVYYKSAWADANGIVTFAWTSKTAAAINVRVQWPGTVAYAVSTSKALGAYYK
jgi:hypothetical protein